MPDLSRNVLIQANKLVYQLARPLVYTRSGQHAHEDALRLLAQLDSNPVAQSAFSLINRTSFPSLPVNVGGVDLPHPLILAAGFVKGHGFLTEQEALNAIRAGHNIIPGWRTMPALVGPVEFGSFTRHPRMGNPGTVIWRHAESRSTQNRVGLKNLGSVAASAFLFQHSRHLPPVFGINIAPTPGINDSAQLQADVIESFRAFIARGIRPSWFTLNLSCPNTEDDPTGHQTADEAHDLCAAVVEFLHTYVAGSIPLWVKVSPALSATQYHTLMSVFAQTGVRAVVATNTLARPAPDDPQVNAGVGGADLHDHALNAIRHLKHARDAHHHPVDIIACGGIQNPPTYHTARQAGAQAAQYWSALVFHGPLAAATILQEAAP